MSMDRISGGSQVGELVQALQKNKAQVGKLQDKLFQTKDVRRQEATLLARDMVALQRLSGHVLPEEDRHWVNSLLEKVSQDKVPSKAEIKKLAGIIADAIELLRHGERPAPQLTGDKQAIKDQVSGLLKRIGGYDPERQRGGYAPDLAIGGTLRRLTSTTDALVNNLKLVRGSRDLEQINKALTECDQQLKHFKEQLLPALQELRTGQQQQIKTKWEAMVKILTEQGMEARDAKALLQETLDAHPGDLRVRLEKAAIPQEQIQALLQDHGDLQALRLEETGLQSMISTVQAQLDNLQQVRNQGQEQVEQLGLQMSEALRRDAVWFGPDHQGPSLTQQVETEKLRLLEQNLAEVDLLDQEDVSPRTPLLQRLELDQQAQLDRLAQQLKQAQSPTDALRIRQQLETARQELTHTLLERSRDYQRLNPQASAWLKLQADKLNAPNSQTLKALQKQEQQLLAALKQEVAAGQLMPAELDLLTLVQQSVNSQGESFRSIASSAAKTETRLVQDLDKKLKTAEARAAKAQQAFENLVREQIETGMDPQVYMRKRDELDRRAKPVLAELRGLYQQKLRHDFQQVQGRMEQALQQARPVEDLQKMSTTELQQLSKQLQQTRQQLTQQTGSLLTGFGKQDAEAFGVGMRGVVQLIEQEVNRLNGMPLDPVKVQDAIDGIQHHIDTGFISQQEGDFLMNGLRQQMTAGRELLDGLAEYQARIDGLISVKAMEARSAGLEKLEQLQTEIRQLPPSEEMAKLSPDQMGKINSKMGRLLEALDKTEQELTTALAQLSDVAVEAEDREEWQRQLTDLQQQIKKLREPLAQQSVSTNFINGSGMLLQAHCDDLGEKLGQDGKALMGRLLEHMPRGNLEQYQSSMELTIMFLTRVSQANLSAEQMGPLLEDNLSGLHHQARQLPDRSQVQTLVDNTITAGMDRKGKYAYYVAMVFGRERQFQDPQIQDLATGVERVEQLGQQEVDRRIASLQKILRYLNTNSDLNAEPAILAQRTLDQAPQRLTELGQRRQQLARLQELTPEKCRQLENDLDALEEDVNRCMNDVAQALKTLGTPKEEIETRKQQIREQLSAPINTQRNLLAAISAHLAFSEAPLDENFQAYSEKLAPRLGMQSQALLQQLVQGLPKESLQQTADAVRVTIMLLHKMEVSPVPGEDLRRVLERDLPRLHELAADPGSLQPEELQRFLTVELPEEMDNALAVNLSPTGKYAYYASVLFDGDTHSDNPFCQTLLDGLKDTSLPQKTVLERAALLKKALNFKNSERMSAEEAITMARQ